MEFRNKDAAQGPDAEADQDIGRKMHERFYPEISHEKRRDQRRAVQKIFIVSYFRMVIAEDFHQKERGCRGGSGVAAEE